MGLEPWNSGAEFSAENMFALHAGKIPDTCWGNQYLNQTPTIKFSPLVSQQNKSQRPTEFPAVFATRSLHA